LLISASKHRTLLQLKVVKFTFIRYKFNSKIKQIEKQMNHYLFVKLKD